MAENFDYTVDIIDGTGKRRMQDDKYSVTANVPGYEDSTLSPVSVTVTADVLVYDFTITSMGTLILHVTEDGTAAGIPIVGAMFYRCDKNGQTYGDAITTDNDGNATIANVPYGSTDAPNVYYKQVISDSKHIFDDTLKTVQLTSQTTTVEVANPLVSKRTINLTDSKYANLPIEAGTLSFSSNE